MTDEQIIVEYAATGDIALLGRLYQRYTALVYGLCLKYLGNAPDAEDAAMEIFEQLVEKVRRHRIRNFRPWLWSLARNHCLMRLRNQKHAIKVDFDDTFVESAPLLHLLDEATHDSALEDCMNRLPEKQKEAIKMFFWDKQSYADIAEHTLWSVANVKSFIQNGKRNLRICLERSGAI